MENFIEDLYRLLFGHKNKLKIYKNIMMSDNNYIIFFSSKQKYFIEKWATSNKHIGANYEMQKLRY